MKVIFFVVISYTNSSIHDESLQGDFHASQMNATERKKMNYSRFFLLTTNDNISNFSFPSFIILETQWYYGFNAKNTFSQSISRIDKRVTTIIKMKMEVNFP